MNWWHRKTISVDLLAVYVVAILLACLFLLWATAGRAEHIIHDGCNTCQQIGPNIYNCTAMMCVGEAEIKEFERKMEVHKTEDCLAKMEAAKKECWREP